MIFEDPRLEKDCQQALLLLRDFRAQARRLGLDSRAVRAALVLTETLDLHAALNARAPTDVNGLDRRIRRMAHLFLTQFEDVEAGK